MTTAEASVRFESDEHDFAVAALSCRLQDPNSGATVSCSRFTRYGHRLVLNRPPMWWRVLVR